LLKRRKTPFFRDWDPELILVLCNPQIAGMGFSTLMDLPNHVRCLAQVGMRVSPVEVRMRYRFTRLAPARIPSDLHPCWSVITGGLRRTATSTYSFYSQIITRCSDSSIGRDDLWRYLLSLMIETGRLLDWFHSQLWWSPPFASYTTERTPGREYDYWKVYWRL